MTIFTITSRAVNASLEDKINKVFPETHFKFTNNVWFVSAKGTPKEICEKIGVTKGGISGVVVMSTTNSYFGVAGTDVWDWLRSAIEKGADG
jgi:hypothetical protein